jgi:hypothetical protein
MTAAGIGAVLVGLAVIDERVRDQFAALITGKGPTGEIGTLSAHVQALAFSIVGSLREQSIEHAPLAIFALAALVLVLFMLRT